MSIISFPSGFKKVIVHSGGVLCCFSATKTRWQRPVVTWPVTWLAKSRHEMDTLSDGIGWVSICLQYTHLLYWIKYNICLVYILTHRWGSVFTTSEYDATFQPEMGSHATTKTTFQNYFLASLVHFIKGLKCCQWQNVPWALICIFPRWPPYTLQKC